MATKIIIKQGLVADIPTLDVGEFGLCTDSKELFVGASSGNVKLAHDADLVSGLAVKADSSTVASDLSLKADASALTSGLALKADVTALAAAVTALTTPSGLVSPFAGASAPTGWLMCDGSAVSRSTYAALFTAIGTTYGSGNGSTTFNIPNLQGVFVRGAGSQTINGITSSGTLGATQGDQMQGHIHNQTQYVVVGGGGLTQASANATNPTSFGTTGPVSDGTNGTPRVGAETRPANVAMNHIIKT